MELGAIFLSCFIERPVLVVWDDRADGAKLFHCCAKFPPHSLSHGTHNNGIICIYNFSRPRRAEDKIKEASSPLSISSLRSMVRMERSEGREKAIVNRLKASPDEIGLFAAFVEKKEERKRKKAVPRTWGF